MNLFYIFPLLLSSVLAANSVSSGKNQIESIHCEFYNSTCIKEAEDQNLGEIPEKCHGIQQCPEDKGICYVVWQNETLGKYKKNQI